MYRTLVIPHFRELAYYGVKFNKLDSNDGRSTEPKIVRPPDTKRVVETFDSLDIDEASQDNNLKPVTSLNESPVIPQTWENRDWDRWLSVPIAIKPDPNCVLAPDSTDLSGTSQDSSELIFRADRENPEIIRSGNSGSWEEFAIYRGTAHVGSQEVKVVCRVAFKKRYRGELLNEANMYMGPLKHLQGKTVPIFYGMFVDETIKPKVVYTVLQDGGDPVRFYDLYTPSRQTK